MKITNTNFFENNKGKKITTIRLSVGDLDQYNIESMDGFAERLSQILPGLSFNGQVSFSTSRQGAGLAEVIARVALALQSLCDVYSTYWQISDTDIPATYEVAFECNGADSGEYVARAAFRVVRAALYRQRYSLEPDINMLRFLITSKKCVGSLRTKGKSVLHAE